MDITSASLLERLQRSQVSPADWQRLHDLYRPLIRSWLVRDANLAGEADDLAQEVMLVLVRELPSFRRQGDGSFRAWLRKITSHRLRTWWRSRQRLPAFGFDQMLEQLEDPNSELSRLWDQEHDRHVFQKLLAIVQVDFEGPTWEAFRAFVLEGKKTSEVAAEFGLSENAVLLCKSRVLKRMRAEAAGLL